MSRVNKNGRNWIIIIEKKFLKQIILHKMNVIVRYPNISILDDIRTALYDDWYNDKMLLKSSVLGYETF